MTDEVEDTTGPCVQCGEKLGKHLMGRRIGLFACPDKSGRKYEEVPSGSPS